MGNDPVDTVVTDFLVKLTTVPITGLIIKVVAADEVHLYFRTYTFDKRELAVLLECIGQSHAAEIGWSEEHLRLWWD